MFDFFKEMYHYSQGCDMEQYREYQKQLERRRNKRFKIFLIVLAVLGGLVFVGSTVMSLIEKFG